jgi:hypothetical protein
LTTKRENSNSDLERRKYFYIDLPDWFKRFLH